MDYVTTLGKTTTKSLLAGALNRRKSIPKLSARV